MSINQAILLDHAVCGNTFVSVLERRAHGFLALWCYILTFVFWHH